MDNIEMGFVVLHYMNDKDTVECINSIVENCNKNTIKIVVIDNGSQNNSFLTLEMLFSKNEFIYLIKSDKNLGFAKGNNLGINYLRINFNCEYVIVMNNDILMLEKNMYNKLIDADNNYSFHILGPNIITKDGRKDSNPSREKLLLDVEKMTELLRKYRFYYFMLITNLIIPYKYLRKKLKRVDDIRTPKHYNDILENVQLHGCFIVFSSRYFDYFKGFDERTFLFKEEEILSLHLYYNNLKSIYYPEIVIYHKEDGATDMLFSTARKKMKFIYKYYIDSMKVLINVYYEYNK